MKTLPDYVSDKRPAVVVPGRLVHETAKRDMKMHNGPTGKAVAKVCAVVFVVAAAGGPLLHLLP